MDIILHISGNNFINNSHLNKKLASVIISSFNHEKYILKAIESVVFQDWRPLEIIFIDDGSSDDTFEIGVQCLKTTNLPFLAIYKHNQGSCVSAINNGIGISRGNYISLLSGDDVYYPNKLSTSIAILNSADAYLAYGDTRSIREDDTIIIPSNSVFMNTQKLYHQGILFESMLRGTEAGFAYLGITFKRDFFDKVGLYDPMILTEDLDMSLRIAMSRIKVAFTSEIVAAHRVLPTSLGHTINTYNYSEKVIRKYAPSYTSIARSLALHRISKGLCLIKNKEAKGLFFLGEGILRYPPVGLSIIIKIVSHFIKCANKMLVSSKK
jgi:cellulose synthase/poly-beta-1,6-N-acetylglucosamine synthase-like glycosyltransferase